MKQLNLFFLVLAIFLFFVGFIEPIEAQTDSTDSGLDKFELGAFAIPIIITNVALLAIGIAYWKKNLPEIFVRSIKFIFNFDISKKIALVAIIILIGSYISLTAQELFIITESELTVSDYGEVKKLAEEWELQRFSDYLPQKTPLKYFLHQASIKLFDNIKVVSYLVSISLLILAYLFTQEITKKRFAGLIAMIILMQSPLFLKYDTDYAYDNTWTLFYLLSLYFLVRQKWHISAFSFVLSLLSKPLTITFLPMTLFFIHDSEFSKKKKLITIIPYAVIIYGVIAAFAAGYFNHMLQQSFNFREITGGLTQFADSAQSDAFVLIFLLPLIVGLFIVSLRGIPYSNAMMILLLGMLLANLFLVGLTKFADQPYRHIPTIVFFAISAGFIFSCSAKRTQSSSKQRITSSGIFIATFITATIFMIPAIFPYLFERYIVITV